MTKVETRYCPCCEGDGCHEATRVAVDNYAGPSVPCSCCDETGTLRVCTNCEGCGCVDDKEPECHECKGTGLEPYDLCDRQTTPHRKGFSMSDFGHRREDFR